MIQSWRNSATRQFAELGKSKFSGLDEGLAKRRLDLLNAAVTLDSLGQLRSIGLHALKGDRQGQWAITINGPWRLVFRFEGGHAHDVEIVDYH